MMNLSKLSEIYKQSVFFPLFFFMMLLGGALFASGCKAQKTIPSVTELTITGFNAGKADAFILLSADHVTVIDTATDPEGQKLVDYLNAANVKKIDELIITHYDKDHVGGADKLIDAFDIGKIYTSYRVKDSDETDEFFTAMQKKNITNEEVAATFTYEADGVKYTIYPPQNTSYKKDASNNSSLVIRVCVGEKSILFTGDAEKARIKELLDQEDIQSDILKMPHHGKNEDNLKKLLKAVQPEYAIITASVPEPADAEVVTLLTESDIKTYFTQDGNITIQMTENTINIWQ